MRRLWAEQDEGPYHRDSQPQRRDVVEDRDGIALQLGIRLARDGDTPLPRRDRGDLAVRRARPLLRLPAARLLGRRHRRRPRRAASTSPSRPSCAAARRTDAAGMVEFRTIYPGWYPGRTVHIHLMVHADDAVLTSQLYFPDEVSDQVLARAPYAERPGRDTTNATDEIFPTGGDPAVLDVERGRRRIPRRHLPRGSDHRYDELVSGSSSRRRVVTSARNPFHRLAEEHRTLVCGMNLDFLRGLLNGIGSTEELTARLAPEPGRCCVRIVAD